MKALLKSPRMIGLAMLLFLPGCAPHRNWKPAPTIPSSNEIVRVTRHDGGQMTLANPHVSTDSIFGLTIECEPSGARCASVALTDIALIEVDKEPPILWKVLADIAVSGLVGGFGDIGKGSAGRSCWVCRR